MGSISIAADVFADMPPRERVVLFKAAAKTRDQADPSYSKGKPGKDLQIFGSGDIKGLGRNKNFLESESMARLLAKVRGDTEDPISGLIEDIKMNSVKARDVYNFLAKIHEHARSNPTSLKRSAVVAYLNEKSQAA